MWAAITPEEYGRIFRENANRLHVFSSATYPEGNEWMGIHGKYILTEWGVYEPVKRPMLKFMDTARNGYQYFRWED